MPLLESDVGRTPLDMEDGYRPRTDSTGSSGGGIRNFFRKKHKSGDDAYTSSRGSSRGNSPGTTPSKMRNFLDVIRPKQKELNIPGAKGPDAMYESGRRPRSISVQEEKLLMHQRSPPPGPGPTPMSQLLNEASGGYNRNQILMDMYRNRAYSDPKPRSRQAALAARNAMLAKRQVRPWLW